MRPDYKRPYFYINNVNLPWKYSENVENRIGYGNEEYDGNEKYPTESSTNPIKSSNPDNADHINRTDSVKPEDTRLANTSEVRLELRFGDDDTVFTPEYIYIDYIKAPMFIRLTYDEITDIMDKTRVLEFPDYVCYEIVNEFVKLLMENASDPRLQSNYSVNQTIADPTAVPQSQSSRDKS